MTQPASSNASPEITIRVEDDRGNSLTDAIFWSRYRPVPEEIDPSEVVVDQVIFVGSSMHMIAEHTVKAGENLVVLPRLAQVTVTVEGDRVAGTVTKFKRVRFDPPQGLHEPDLVQQESWRQFNEEGKPLLYSGLRPHADYELSLTRGEKLLAPVQTITLEPGEHREITLEPEGFRSFTGRVVDPLGNPIAGAKVGLTFWSKHTGRGIGVTPTDDEGRFTIREPSPEAFVESEHQKRTIRVSGSYQPEPGVIWIGAWDPPWPESNYHMGDLVLGEGARFTGTAMLEGKPVAGIRAAAWQTRFHEEVMTSADGSFTIVGFDPDETVNYQVEHAGYHHKSGSFKPTDHAGTPFRFDLSRWKKGTLKIVMPEDDPYGTLITLRENYRSWTRASVNGTQSYEYEPGKVELWIQTPNGVTRLQEFDIRDQETIVYSPVMVAPATIEIPSAIDDRRVSRVIVSDEEGQNMFLAFPDRKGDGPGRVLLAPDLPFTAEVVFGEGEPKTFKFDAGLPSGKTTRLGD